MNIIHETNSILELSGYKTKYTDADANLLYFEDDCLLGFVTVFLTVGELSTQWKEKHDAFLTKNAGRLRVSPLKAWNCYSIFLTPDDTDSFPMHTFLEIEDNLQGTRKIARYSVRTRKDIIHALYPIMPIQNRVALSSEKFLDRVKERVDLKERTIAAFLGGASPDEIATLLMEEE